MLQSETIQERLSHLKQQEYQITAPHNIQSNDSATQSATTASSAADVVPTGKALLLDNFLDDSVQHQHQPRQIRSNVEPRNVEHIYVHQIHTNVDPASLQPINIQSTDDELFLLIDDKAPRQRPVLSTSPSKRRRRTDYVSDDLDSGVHVEYRQYVLNRKLQRNVAQQQQQQRISSKLLQLAEGTPKRKFRTRCDFNRLRAHSMNRSVTLAAADVASAPLATSSSVVAKPFNKNQKPTESTRCAAIRQEVATRLLDVDQLLQYEYQLSIALERSAAQFRDQNEMYTIGSGVMAADVERVQAQLDAIAKQIVDGEFELFKVQLEISQKCGVLHNLKRMLSIAEEAESSSGGSVLSHHHHNGSALVLQRIEAEHRKHCAEMQVFVMEGRKIESQNVDETFVDNVNEFCDKNKSIIV